MIRGCLWPPCSAAIAPWCAGQAGIGPAWNFRTSSEYSLKRWHDGSQEVYLKWKVHWMQSIPRADNGLTFKGKRLTNWWFFKGDWDYIMKNRIGLVER